MKKFFAGLAAALLCMVPMAAFGQNAPPTPPPISVLSGQVSLAVSNVSSRVALPSSAAAAIAVTVYNSGSNDAYIATGTVAVVATSGGTCVAGSSGPSCRILAGTSLSFYTGDAYLAAITASSTTTLIVYQGTGPLPIQGVGSTAGVLPTGAATAANQTTQITAAGAPTDAAVTNPASSASTIASLKGILTQLQAAQPAGTNIVGRVGIDQTTPGTTNGVQVNAALPVGTNNIGTVNGSTVGGYEFNASVIPTTTNASHAAGVALADLQTISIGSTNSLSGIVTQIQYASKGGSTSGVVVYLWSKLPAATTCTNGSALVTSQTDNQFLVFPPILLTPALVLSAQDTGTYTAATNLVGNFINGSSNTNLYECTVSNATQTPATATDIRINIQGIKDQP